MNAAKSSHGDQGPRPGLRINAVYQVAPGTPAEALHEDAALLAGIAIDIITTVAHGLCEEGDIAANPRPTANVLFGAQYLLRLATGAMEAARSATGEEGEP